RTIEAVGGLLARAGRVGAGRRVARLVDGWRRGFPKIATQVGDQVGNLAAARQSGGGVGVPARPRVVAGVARGVACVEHGQRRELGIAGSRVEETLLGFVMAPELVERG